MKRLALLLESTLAGYAAVLFSDSKSLGLLFLGATFFNVRAGLAGLTGAVFSNLAAMSFKVHEDRVRKGLYAFNGLLVGLALSLYHQFDLPLVGILLVALVLLLFITLSVEHVFGYFLGLPALSLPFVLTGMVVYFAFFNYGAFTPVAPFPFAGDAAFPELPAHLVLYLKSMGAIFFQTSPWAGLAVAAAVLVFSRLAFLLSIAGYAAGVAFHLALGGNVADIAPGSLGFNNILVAIAVGGIFLVPSGRTFLLAVVAALLSSLLGSFTKIFLVNFSMPVLALPFVTVTLLVLYGLKQLANRSFRIVDFPPGSPEKNIDYFKTRLERFGDTGLEIRLPFLGSWRVTQGYDGAHTHRHQWRESLDFMAVGPDGGLHRGERPALADYYTFGLPVLAPADGRVVRVVDHLDDNPPGEMDTRNNWGNLVLVQHGPALYSQLSHLKKESVTVKEGDQVRAGARLGLAGNSGRSGEPHLHLHFQRTPEIGSPTVGVPFTQLVAHGAEARIRFNAVPAEGDEVSGLMPDFNTRAFFNLAPGKSFLVRYESDRGKSRQETWTAGVDFFGSRFLDNGHGDRMFFVLSAEYFAGLSYRGSRDSALFRFFIAAYRVPFGSQAAAWEDRLSHTLFASWPARLFLDMALPFTDRWSCHWSARLEKTDKGLVLVSQVFKGRQRTRPLCTNRLALDGELPGTIVTEKGNGEHVEVHA